MATLTFQWTTQLVSSVMVALATRTAALRELFTFHMLLKEQDSVTVVKTTSAPTMTPVVKGTPLEGNYSNIVFGGVKITPDWGTVKFPVPKDDLANAQAGQIEALRDLMVQAALTRLMDKFETAVATADVKGSTGAALTAQMLDDASWDVIANKFGTNGVSALLTVRAFRDLKADIIAGGWEKFGPMVSEVQKGGLGMIRQLDQTRITWDQLLGNDGTDGYNFVGDKKSMRFVVGADVSKNSIVITDHEDAVHKILALPLLAEVGFPDDRAGFWLKSQA